MIREDWGVVLYTEGCDMGGKRGKHPRVTWWLLLLLLTLGEQYQALGQPLKKKKSLADRAAGVGNSDHAPERQIRDR